MVVACGVLIDKNLLFHELKIWKSVLYVKEILTQVVVAGVGFDSGRAKGALKISSRDWQW